MRDQAMIALFHALMRRAGPALTNHVHGLIGLCEETTDIRHVGAYATGRIRGWRKFPGNDQVSHQLLVKRRGHATARAYASTQTASWRTGQATEPCTDSCPHLLRSRPLRSFPIGQKAETRATLLRTWRTGGTFHPLQTLRGVLRTLFST